MLKDSPSIAILVAALLAALVSAGLGLWLRRFAIRRQLFDLPNERSLHSSAVPRLGGIAIWNGVAVGSVALLRTGFFPADVIGVYAGLALGAVIVLGSVDDIRPLPAGLRLLVQGFVSLFFATVVVPGLPSEATLASLLWFSAVVVWLVGLTNAYNFMDGIDAIAAAQSVVASCGLLMLAWVSSVDWLVVPAVLVGSASAGFLTLNWPPARMFMGDSGSTGLGFAFAALVVLTSMDDLMVAIAGATFVWPFIFDTSITWFRRVLRGDDLFRPHRSHLYQRLIGAGWSHGSVALLYAALAVIGGTAGIHGVLTRTSVMMSVIPALAAWLWWMVGKAERRASSNYANSVTIG